MIPLIQEQLEAERDLCEAILELIDDRDYSVYDVREAVAKFTGQILATRPDRG